jgi:hypothetical protein
MPAPVLGLEPDVEARRRLREGREVWTWFARDRLSFLRDRPPGVPPDVLTSVSRWGVDGLPFYVEFGPACLALKRCPDDMRPCRCECNDLYGFAPPRDSAPPGWWVAAVHARQRR